MPFPRSLLFLVPALAATLAPARDAAACGAYFYQPAETTQVASHRMILSVSQKQSTLYDQVAYSGSPSSFAWVLPVKGMVTVGLSSDALFAELDDLTKVTVQGPTAFCPPCSAEYSASGAGTGPTSSATGGVTVVAQMVVGPYETVQLSSANPSALTDWLAMHGYAVPADVQPIISAYVSEGFDFLALKLVPGKGIDAMKPVSVTTPGASPVLPLRMVAAGVGATVPITLFVLGEGRYEPTNFPWFTISPDKLVWDFAAGASNYKALRQQGFDATQNKGWLVESASPVSEETISAPVMNLALTDPTMSGYADSMGNGAAMNAQADLATLFDGINAPSLWLTRLLAELPRAALSTDLSVGAAASQTSVSSYLFAAKSINPPSCPCQAGSTGTGGASGAGGAGGMGQQGGGCTVGGTSGTPFVLFGLLAALALAAMRRSSTLPRT